MDFMSLMWTICICLISVVLEGISANKKGKGWFDSLRQPKYSLTMKIWYIVGGVYYFIFGYMLYILFLKDAKMPIFIVTLIMLLNGLSNFILFKLRNLKYFYFAIYIFHFLLIALAFFIWDMPILMVLDGLYFTWLIYDAYYFYCLWKLNE